MRLRNRLNGYEYEARLTTESSASPYGQPILIDAKTNKPVDLFSVALTVIVEATDEERQALAEAGYRIQREAGRWHHGYEENHRCTEGDSRPEVDGWLHRQPSET
jgi:hypothetical protein